MIYDWYKIYNLTTFEESGLPSKNVAVILGDRGLKNILITKGNHVSVLFDDVFLSIGLNSRSPFGFENRAVYVDANNDIWVGVATS